MFCKENFLSKLSGVIAVVLFVFTCSMASGETLLEEDFEAYPTGSFPSSPWEPHYNIISDPSHNIVTNADSHGGERSLQLYGAHSGCWAAETGYPMSFPDTVVIECAIKASADIFTSSSCHDWDIAVGLGLGFHPSGSDWFTLARFDKNSNIRGIIGDVIQPYQAGVWYVIKAEVYFIERKVDYWINGNYVGTQTNLSLLPASVFTHLHLSSGGGKGWVDDIVVKTQPRNKVLAVVEDGTKSFLDVLLPSIGLQPVYSTTFPPDMSEYCLVICQLYSACNLQSAGYIENYVNFGGGVIVTDGSPYFLAGQSRNLTALKHWFGAGYYPNDNDTVSLIVDHPFGTDLVSGTFLFQDDAPCNWGAAASDLQPGAHAVAQYHGRCGNSIAAFYYTCGSGRVYYSWSFVHDTPNQIALMKAAMEWAAGSCVSPVTIHWSAPASATWRRFYYIRATAKNRSMESQNIELTLSLIPDPDPPSEMSSLDWGDAIYEPPISWTIPGVSEESDSFRVMHTWQWIPEWNEGRLVFAAIAPLWSYFFQKIDPYQLDPYLQAQIVLLLDAVPEVHYMYEFWWDGQSHNCTIPVRVLYAKEVGLWNSLAMSIIGYMANLPIHPLFYLEEVLAIITAEFSYKAAADPPDTNFMVVVSPEWIGLPEIELLPDGPEKGMTICALRLLIYQRALLSAMEKYEGAKEVRSIEWMVIHSASAKLYAEKCIAQLDTQLAIARDYFPNLPIPSEEEIQAFRDSLIQFGLPEIVVQILSRFGYSEGAMADIRDGLVALDNSCYSDIRRMPEVIEGIKNGFAIIRDGLCIAPEGATFADIGIHPNTLNLGSGGNYITCYIELPYNYNVDQIDLSSVRLNGLLEAETSPNEIGDYDRDGHPDLMVKFNRQILAEVLAPGEKLLSISGAINNLNPMTFAGVQSIRVMDPAERPKEIGDKRTNPRGFSLSQNYPNPFNPTCEIRYALPTDCHVTLSIYNILGQRVRVLVDENESTGNKSIKWDGKDEEGREVTSGVYFYRLQAGEFTDSKKMVILK